MFFPAFVSCICEGAVWLEAIHATSSSDVRSKLSTWQTQNLKHFEVICWIGLPKAVFFPVLSVELTHWGEVITMNFQCDSQNVSGSGFTHTGLREHQNFVYHQWPKKSRKSFQTNSWWSQVQKTKLPCLWNDAKAGIVPLAWTTSPPTSGGSEAAIPRLRQTLIFLKTWRKWGGQRCPNQLQHVISACLQHLLGCSSNYPLALLKSKVASAWFCSLNLVCRNDSSTESIRPWFNFSILHTQSKIHRFPKYFSLSQVHKFHTYLGRKRCHHDNAIFCGNPSKSPAICMFVSK